MLTEKDEQLIALLKADARQPVATLARKLGVSRTTVQDRLRRLEDTGIVSGYTVRLGTEAEAQGLKAFVTISVDANRVHDVIARLTSVIQVQALYTVSGKFDLVAVVHAQSSERLDRLLDEIGSVPGVLRTQSSIILSTKLQR